MHALSFHTVECPACLFLAVLHVISYAVEVDAIFSSVNLLKNLSRLEIIDKQLCRVVLILKDKLALVIMKK